MFTFLMVVQGLIAAALIGVILMQKSEGGGLGVGGSPAGFLSARGAADFLTRATALLATAFVVLSIVLAVLASVGHKANDVDVDAAAAVAGSSVPVAPATTSLPGVNTGVPAATANTATTAPVTAPVEKGVPLQR